MYAAAAAPLLVVAACGVEEGLMGRQVPYNPYYYLENQFILFSYPTFYAYRVVVTINKLYLICLISDQSFHDEKCLSIINHTG